MQISIPTHASFPQSTGLLAGDQKKCGNSIHEEWALIEVQGAVESEDGVDVSGMLMGRVTFDKEMVPFLVVGRHRLKGERVSLKLPFAVVRQEIVGMGEGSRDCEVVCILKHKYLFSERPVPILSEQNVGLPGLMRQTR
ncbi:Chromosome transmission fidelity protein 8 [Podochytrium sp. JEL0797]|nr:Chromosome transmission fidelity protein 8 [Podochytrium sp. JEL0797]